jgi:hypothetical protein
LEEQLEQQNYTKEQIFILEETSLVWKTLPNDNYGPGKFGYSNFY